MKKIHDFYSSSEGNLARAVRLIRKGGRFKYDTFWFQDDKLLPFVGQQLLIRGCVTDREGDHLAMSVHDLNWNCLHIFPDFEKKS